MRLKNDSGHFTFMFKVISSAGAALLALIAIGGAAFQIDERHAHTIQVAGQFKAIDDSRQLDNLNNALIQTQIRLDILEDRLFREQNKTTPSVEYVNKLKSDIRKLNTQFNQINEKLLSQ